MVTPAHEGMTLKETAFKCAFPSICYMFAGCMRPAAHALLVAKPQGHVCRAVMIAAAEST